jgi:outer membrane lipoprotein
VRWGGEILNVEPRANSTCFEILSRALYADARPMSDDYSEGRFIACKPGFFDPYVYTQGRDVTVVGTVGGNEQHKVGEFDYTFVTVEASQIYLWPESDYYAGDVALDPLWWYGWNRCFDSLWAYPCYGWGWGGFGYFGGYHHHYRGGRGWSGRGGSSGHAGGFHGGGSHGGAHGH